MELVNNMALWQEFLKGNGYSLRESIGHGGFGDVFSAVSSTDGVKYAIKRLVSRRNIMADPSAVREIKALVEFNHSCVILMKEVLLWDRMACIVMELASRGNLEMVVQNSALSQLFVVRAFRQITCAVEFCHRSKVAHRDINPSNVLVFDTGDVKIADFGLCFRCKDETNGNDLLCSDYLGQETYLAPEVKAQKPYHPIPADIWSLGCVLLFMVSNPTKIECQSGIINNSESNIPHSESISRTECIHSICDRSDKISENPPLIANMNSTKEFLCCAAELKGIKPPERPSATEVLQQWTKIGAEFLK